VVVVVEEEMKFKAAFSAEESMDTMFCSAFMLLMFRNNEMNEWFAKYFL